MNEQSDPATDHMLCMAVDCKAIATIKCKCIVHMEENDKEEIHTIRFCREHYLSQKAMEYSR